MHAGQMAGELSEREQALRNLPLPYSLAFRLRDAGVAPEQVCEYLGVEEDALAGVYRIAEAKLSAAPHGARARCDSSHHNDVTCRPIPEQFE